MKHIVRRTIIMVCVVVDAPSPEAAIQAAAESEDWADQQDDYTCEDVQLAASLFQEAETADEEANTSPDPNEGISFKCRHCETVLHFPWDEYTVEEITAQLIQHNTEDERFISTEEFGDSTPKNIRAHFYSSLSHIGKFP